jgi:hypothetical protein
MNRALLVLCAACGSHEAPFTTIEIATPPGISDLTLDDHGHLWAIAERDRVAVEMTPDGQIVATHPVNIPPGVDTEAIAFIGPREFVIGTEGEDKPTASVVWMTLDDHGALQVEHELPLKDSDLGVTLTNNHGVEAVCGKGDDVLVAIEEVGKDDHGRYAPLVRLRNGGFQVGKLRLTSDVGKISALACTWRPDGWIDIHAIERHYKVSRIVHGTLAPSAVDLTPTVELDLEPTLHDSLNLEGLVQLGNGKLVAVNDNQSSTVTGPTYLLRFK